MGPHRTPKVQLSNTCKHSCNQSMCQSNTILTQCHAKWTHAPGLCTHTCVPMGVSWKGNVDSCHHTRSCQVNGTASADDAAKRPCVADSRQDEAKCSETMDNYYWYDGESFGAYHMLYEQNPSKHRGAQVAFASICSACPLLWAWKHVRRCQHYMHVIQLPPSYEQFDQHKLSKGTCTWHIYRWHMGCCNGT
jgi:hypothetical protein